MCDTFVALPEVTRDGSIIFGKNSDREPNEAQSLEYIPEKRYPRDATLQTTYLTLPQVPVTNAILICRPFWMWGAEMGANDKGVVIGNEAVFTRQPVVREKVLTGMDLLRLALERANSAQHALEIITGLLADFGQGGKCGYQDKNLKYHNSFILADPGQAWVLETAGSLWAAKQVKDYYAISNGLTLGADFDISHPDLITAARKKGRLQKGQDFNFRTAYSDWFYTTFSASRQRRRRSLMLLEEKKGRLDTAGAISLLRDHGHAEYTPDSHFLMHAICAHSANKISRHAAQTTGSLIACMKKGIQTYWATGTSAPCTGLFKPFRFSAGIPLETGSIPGASFDPASLWWQHEILHRSVLIDFIPRLKTFHAERDNIEMQWREQAAREETSNISELTRAAFALARKKIPEWTSGLHQLPPGRSRRGYRNYWRRQNQKAGFPPDTIR